MAWSWIRSGEELLALSREDAYASIAQDMRRRVDYWKTHFTDWPDRKTGWMHNYVCPVCTGFLKYDPDKPEEHRCPACGIAVENTKLVLEAWMYMRRFEIATTLVDAAILYVLEGDETDAAFVTRVVDFYADHYLEFEEYGINAGRGRIMGQSLDEAVWATSALKALMTIGFDGKSSRGQRWHQRLFLPISRLVVAQTGMIHNIPLWHASSAFCAGLFFGDERLVNATVGGELGLRNQILKGFTEDSVWFENSTGYHYYAMNAATTACLFARWAGKQDQYVDLFDRVAGAYTALYKLRFRDRTMTAFNDSSRRDGVNGAKIHLGQYLEAFRVFEGVADARGIQEIVSDLDASGTRGAFLFGVPEKTASPAPVGSVNLAHNCLGLLRAEGIEVFCKYGNLSRSHAHPDALEICIPTFSCDLGNPGYGSPFHRGWYTQTLAHNTFLIDGASQRPDARGTGALSEDGTALALRIDDAYAGVSAQRDLSVHGSTLEDCMRVRCDAPRQIDWVFHSEGEAAFEGSMAEASLPETENGYGYLTDARRVEGPFAARFTIDGETLSLKFRSLPENAAIYVAKSPNNPANLQRHTVIVRTKASEAEIQAVYSIDRQA